MYSNSKKVREAVTSDNGSIVCTVNSFTSDEYAPYDDANGDDYNSAKRYKVVMDSFMDKLTADYLETPTRLLKGEYGFMCPYEDTNSLEFDIQPEKFDGLSGRGRSTKKEIRNRQQAARHEVRQISSGRFSL